MNSDFYNSDLIFLGGTALVPQIHDNHSDILARAKENHCLTLVNTVFDFRNEKLNSDKPWPLVTEMSHLELIDVLIMDKVEALRISGNTSIENSADYFSRSGVSCFIITNGADDLRIYSDGRLFEKTKVSKLPVSDVVKNEIQSGKSIKGDTTGCGDNFAGGIIASIAWQLKLTMPGSFDLIKAISWGVSSGGFCCYYFGGTFLESYPGEKLSKIRKLQSEYINQFEKLN